MARNTVREAGDNRTILLDGSRLTALRRARGLTREQLADAADGAHRLSEATIKRAESGARVYLETARRLAGILGVSLEALGAGHESAQLAGVADSAEAPVAVAVLPFQALDRADDTRTLGEGLAEDLTTRLGYRWFPVISRGSTARYRELLGQSIVASELEVAYVVDGSVQRVGERLRIHARLVDARAGTILWAAEYNRSLAQLFMLQDEITAGIVDGVHRKLLSLAEQRMAHVHPDDLSAWHLAARGSQLFYDGTRKANASARELLRSALQRDRSLIWAGYLLGLTYQRELANQWSDAPADSLSRLAELSVELERHHGSDGRTDVIAAYALVYRGERERAVERLHDAVGRSPNLNAAYSLLGQAMAMGNEPETALEQLEIAARLSPRDSDLWSVRTATALAFFVAEDYARAVQWAASAVSLRPDIAFAYGALAAAHAFAGELDQARASLETLRRLHPHASTQGFGAILVSTRPDIATRFLRGMQLAGLS